LDFLVAHNFNTLDVDAEEVNHFGFFFRFRLENLEDASLVLVFDILFKLDAHGIQAVRRELGLVHLAGPGRLPLLAKHAQVQNPLNVWDVVNLQNDDFRNIYNGSCHLPIGHG